MRVEVTGSGWPDDMKGRVYKVIRDDLDTDVYFEDRGGTRWYGDLNNPLSKWGVELYDDEPDPDPDKAERIKTIIAAGLRDDLPERDILLAVLSILED